MSDPNDTQNPDDTSAENLAAMRGKNEALERELAFTKAGIDTESPQGKVLMETFKGKLDVDAIKAYRTEIFGEPATTTPPPADQNATPAEGQQATDQADPFATEVAGQQAMRDALAQGMPGQTETEPPTKNTYDDALEHFHDDRKQGVALERAQLAAIDRVVVAGAEGREDVIHDPVEWERQQAEAGHRPKQMTG